MSALPTTPVVDHGFTTCSYNHEPHTHIAPDGVTQLPVHHHINHRSDYLHNHFVRKDSRGHWLIYDKEV